MKKYDHPCGQIQGQSASLTWYHLIILLPKDDLLVRTRSNATRFSWALSTLHVWGFSGQRKRKSVPKMTVMPPLYSKA